MVLENSKCESAQVSPQRPLILAGIYHCGGKESMTKYGMLKHMSQAFQLPMDHIVADPNPVPGPPRPQNAQLSNSRIDSLGITKHTPFAEAITTALRPWLGRFPSP